MKTDLNGMPGRIRAARELSGKTQKELAEETYCNKCTVANMECGRTIPNVDTLARICDALDVTMQWIVCGGTE